MTDQIEITETWKIIDRWWTDQPIVRYWAALKVPDGECIAIRWENTSGEWSLHPEPKDPQGSALAQDP